MAATTEPSLRRVVEDLAKNIDMAVSERDSAEEVSAEIMRELRKPPVVRQRPRVQPAPAPSGTHSTLAEISSRIAQCKKCALHETRTNVVPGQGNQVAEILFVGEAPGADEDEQGLAFVGLAGQLLTKMIEAMGFKRDEVFIANILKCRPPNNRQPDPSEMATCMPFLKEQIVALKPKVIVALGGTAAHGLLGVEAGITSLRGKWHKWEGIDLMPTFHPSYLLRSPSAKKEVWQDLQEVLRFLGRTPPPPAKKSTAGG